MAGFLGGEATRLKFRGRQPESTGVTNDGPVAKRGGADAKPRACQCGAGLVGPWAAGGHPRQHNDGGHAARKRQDLQRLRDRFEVVELRAAGDDDQVGDTSGFQRRVLGSGRRIDDDNVNVVRRGRGEGARQTGGLHSKHKWGVGGAAGAPLAGGRLGIDVEHNGGPAGLLDSDGKGEGERGFPAPAFLRDDLDQLYSKALALYSKGSVPAGRLALSIMGRRAKLNGLDAPTKIAPTDPTGEHTADTAAIKALFMTVWCPDSRSVESNCGIPRG